MKKKLFLLLGGLMLTIASAFGQRSLEMYIIRKIREKKFFIICGLKQASAIVGVS